MSNSRDRGTLDEVLALLDAEGIKYTVEGRKHAKVFWSSNGHKFIETLSRTPSDHRARMNTIARVKRHLREAGHGV